MNDENKPASGPTPKLPGLAAKPAAFPYYGEYDENGVDLSLLRYTLSLTPLQRLVLMERHACDVQVLNEYGRRHRRIGKRWEENQDEATLEK